MIHPSILIQGNIISGEILEKIHAGEANYFQQPVHFGTENSLRDEISNAWVNTKALWSIFQTKRNRLKDSESGTTETRVSWMIPFLAELGFNAVKSPLFVHAESHKSFTISHRDEELNNFPIHLVSFRQSLDKTTERGKISPHAMAQEFLNCTEQTYALVSNGLFIRLLRDSSRLVKPTFLEFNLERIMEEDLFPDFAVLFRTLHSSRFALREELTEGLVFEYYHQQSLESGARLRENLSIAVINALVGYPNGINQKRRQYFDNQKGLANGLLQNPHNGSFAADVRSGSVTAKALYRQLLRLIYRFLFLIVTEERDLIYPSLKDEKMRRFKRIYDRFYSIDRLRKLAGERAYADENKEDLWESLKATFMLFEDNRYGSRLGIQSLASGLFDPDAIPLLRLLRLDNRTLIHTIRGLCYFINPETGSSVRVNYSDLDVEEFGSVYEGLLEFEPAVRLHGADLHFELEFGTDRGNSGSHYTPEELCKPLITNSLEHKIWERINRAGIKTEEAIDKISQEKRQEAIRQILSLKVCDIACGSGHILLSAARRLAFEVARLTSGEEQPNPTVMRQAMRKVIKNCIYGVDYNPLAVELCKVALWLESHNPGEPLGFLDHHIKCGNSVVGIARKEDLFRGIADQAFKKTGNDDGEVASLYKKRNRKGRIAKEQIGLWERSVETDINELLDEFERFARMPENSTEEVSRKADTYARLTTNAAFRRIKTLADIQIAQFFIPKTEEYRSRLVTNESYFAYLRGEGVPENTDQVAKSFACAKKFFHWFLEFPEIFAYDGGFDCIIGNPPFLGGQKISGKYGTDFLEYLKHEYAPIGAVDFVAYFFRRAFSLIKNGGYQSLISTNTISQGGTRQGGLEVICNKGGTIHHAVRSMKWPGDAKVDVSLISIYKGKWTGSFLLDQKKVNRISTFLDDSEVMENPYPLRENAGKSFQGSIVLGKGFLVTKEHAAELISMDPRNREVLFPYLSGDDLNNDPEQKPSRWVINFFDWSEQRARTYPACFEIVERYVKPERTRWKKDKEGNEIVGTFALRKPLPQKWWIYGEKRPALYRAISKADQVMVVARVAKHFSPCFVPAHMVYHEKTIVFTLQSYSAFAFLQSSIYREWIWNRGTTMGSVGLSYTPSDNFENFPFAYKGSKQERELERTGKCYHELRNRICHKYRMGFTQLYNLFHCKELAPCDPSSLESEDKVFAKEFGRELFLLRKHLVNHAIALSEFNGIYEEICQLRSLQIKMDCLVLAAYGWEQIPLQHEFYELEYLPVNECTRFTIHPDIRKEILKRIIHLNHEYHQKEVSGK